VKRKIIATAALAAALSAVAAPAFSEDLEVLHFWTSGSESKAANVLKDLFESKGDKWIDSGIAGGGGISAYTALKAAVVAGSPPGAVQMRGQLMHEWADQDALVNVDATATKWSAELPAAIDEASKYKDHYYAAPLWIHRGNWMYINKELLDKVGGTVPTNWDEYFALADKFKAAGYIGIAHGETPYEDGVLFEDVMLSMGPDFYQKAMLESDADALASPKLVQVFDIMRRMQGYWDNSAQGRPWNLSVALVINGKAGMYFMGDWAKGEFSVAGKEPDKDFACAPVPGTGGTFTFASDSLVFFDLGSQKATQGQLDLASAAMDPAMQAEAAKYKGSIPSNQEASMDGFDACALKSAVDLKEANGADTLLATMAQGYGGDKIGAVRDVVVRFLASDQDSKTAAAAMAKVLSIRE
jgi:glucose/mannose transport system substrate-binding protein